MALLEILLCLKNNGYFPDTQRTDGTYGRYAAIDDKMEGYIFIHIILSSE